jgi:hypothetical protein
MEFKKRTLMQLADMICGNAEVGKTYFFPYRSSSKLTLFFEDAGTNFRHDGSTRNYWVAEVLGQTLAESQTIPNMPPESFLRVVVALMDQGDAFNEGSDRGNAMSVLNAALQREGYEAFYGDDRKCYLKHIGTNTVGQPGPNPHRPFSRAEIQKREQLVNYLNNASEDQLIEEILLPLFRQLGFQRITAAGHKDKALEFGKDIWMKFVLPTLHVLYFGIQVKKDKLDAAGMTKAGNFNVAEVHRQVTMMLGHDIFDPEIGKRVLVDHAYIIAGGEITKAARLWIGNMLDTSRRSQIMFMDRDDILNLYVVTSLQVPGTVSRGPEPLPGSVDDLPF